MQMIQESTNNLLAKLKEALEERSLAATPAHELRTPLLAAARLRIANVGSTAAGDGAGGNGMKRLRRWTGGAAPRCHCRCHVPRPVRWHGNQSIWRPRLRCRGGLWRDPDAFGGLAQIDSDEPITTVGDYDALRPALRNLIENAFMPTGPASKSRSCCLQRSSFAISARVNPENLAVMSTRHIRRSSDQAGYGWAFPSSRPWSNGMVEAMDRSPAPGHPTGLCCHSDFPSSSSGASNGAAR